MILRVLGSWDKFPSGRGHWKVISGFGCLILKTTLSQGANITLCKSGGKGRCLRPVKSRNAKSHNAVCSGMLQSNKGGRPLYNFLVRRSTSIRLEQRRLRQICHAHKNYWTCSENPNRAVSDVYKFVSLIYLLHRILHHHLQQPTKKSINSKNRSPCQKNAASK
jgi:hypothetical protein